MKSIKLFSIVTITASLLHRTMAFAGDFLVSNIFVDIPESSYGSSVESSYVYFDFSDQDTVQIAPVPCFVFWPIGGSPESGTSLCANNSYTAQLNEETFSSAHGFEIEMSHTYMDDSVGEYPYNLVTKFGGLNVTFPNTTHYHCEVESGKCWSQTGTSYLALVTAAIS